MVGRIVTTTTYQSTGTVVTEGIVLVCKNMGNG